MLAPLAGVKILDLSRLLPGPYCTMLLADLGAEVVKVELPGVGDYARTISEDFGGPPMFGAVNRGKRSLALNFRNPKGRDLLLHLAGQFDVFLETFRPGAAARWGIDYAAVHEANPRLIYCSLSGYGQEGPYAERAGHDLNYVAVGGLLALNGVAGGPPLPPGVQIADLAGGMLAALAIVAALRRRDQNGQGAYLDVSMLDAVVSWVGHLADCFQAPCNDGFVATRGRMPLSGSLPCYHVYVAADGHYLALSALEPHFWSAFCQVAGCNELLERRLDPTAIPELETLFAGRTRAEWLALVADVDACLEPVNELGEMLQHPQVRERGLVDAAGRVQTPMRFAAGGPPAPAPRLGQHTREILEDAGLSHGEIAALGAAGIVAFG